MRLLPEPFEGLRREAGLSDPAYLAALLGVFLIPGLLGTTETVAFWRMAGESYGVGRALVLQLPQWLVYAAAAPAILWFGGRVPIRKGRWAGPMGAHAVLALVLGTAYAVVAGVSSHLYSPFPSSRSLGETIVGWYLAGLPVMVLTYFAVLGGGWGLYWFSRHRAGEVAKARLEAQLADARLASLRMQLHPHFLFNSLNAVTVLVRDRDWERAEHAVHLLAGLLRESLHADAPDRIPLRDEVDFIMRYLELEGLRFPRLEATAEVPPPLADVTVPALILQPLVENALRHGVARSTSAGRVSLRAREEGGRLVLTVSDDGPGPGASAASSGTGLGLKNVAERLAVLYGDDARVSLEPGAEEGAVATLVLPLDPACREGGAGA